jgi:hypothetical protein
VPGQDDKAFLVIAVQHGLQAKATMQDDPFEQMTAVGSIDPDTVPFLAGASQALEYQLGTGISDRTAEVTTIAKSSPSVSTRVCRLCPLTSFPAF